MNRAHGYSFRRSRGSRVGPRSRTTAFIGDIGEDAQVRILTRLRTLSTMSLFSSVSFALSCGSPSDHGGDHGGSTSGGGGNDSHGGNTIGGSTAGTVAGGGTVAGADGTIAGAGGSGVAGVIGGASGSIAGGGGSGVAGAIGGGGGLIAVAGGPVEGASGSIAGTAGSVTCVGGAAGTPGGNGGTAGHAGSSASGDGGLGGTGGWNSAGGDGAAAGQGNSAGAGGATAASLVLSTYSLGIEGECTAPAQSVTISNPGDSPITWTAEVVVEPPTYFPLPVQIAPLSSTLQPGASDTMQVSPFSFLPVLTGNSTFPGTIRLTPDVSIAVLYGVRGFRAATLPADIDFGSVPLCATKTLSVPTFNIDGTTPRLAASYNSDFFVQGAHTATPPPWDKPPWTLSFAPRALGPRSTTLTVTSSDGVVCAPNTFAARGVGAPRTAANTDFSCGETCAACDGTTPRCKDLGASARCVGCLSNVDCGGATPICDTVTNVCGAPPSCIGNVCGAPPSCVGLAATCGPNGSSNCCESNLLTGGTFNRGNDPKYPATVSDFRLDTYEITVGRFKKFVAEFAPPAAWSGKNPNNPSDAGWNVAWNTGNLANASALAAAVQCNTGFQTYTAGNDALPINCLDWYEAEAFCIWDGGRLPTEAEWMYAATGGTQERTYPWGNTTPGANANLAVFGCYYPAVSGICTGVENLAPVGSIPAGNGLYGQADLVGNVSEWVQDINDAYPNPCNNCANTVGVGFRAVRGGNFASVSPSSLIRDFGIGGSSVLIGARCARGAAGSTD